jgi:large subunit ribosomal protein L30
MAEQKNGKKIKIQWYRSTICTPTSHKTMVRTLGFKKLNQIIECSDNRATRGVVSKIPHLLRIVEE